MAHHLSIDIIAEGTESSEQVELLIKKWAVEAFKVLFLAAHYGSELHFAL